MGRREVRLFGAVQGAGDPSTPLLEVHDMTRTSFSRTLFFSEGHLPLLSLQQGPTLRWAFMNASSFKSRAPRLGWSVLPILFSLRAVSELYFSVFTALLHEERSMAAEYTQEPAVYDICRPERACVRQTHFHLASTERTL